MIAKLEGEASSDAYPGHGGRDQLGGKVWVPSQYKHDEHVQFACIHKKPIPMLKETKTHIITGYVTFIIKYIIIENNQWRVWTKSRQIE